MMNRATLLLAGVGLTAALNQNAPVLPDDDTNLVDAAPAVLSYNNASTVALAIWEKTLLLDMSPPAYTVTSDSLSLEVSFEVDALAAGRVTVGDKVHTISYDPLVSDGISCSQTFNNEHVAVICYVPLATAIKKRGIPGYSGISTAECFEDPNADEILFGVQRPVSEEAIPFFGPESEKAALVRRARETRIRGDGSPYKKKMHKTLVMFSCHEGGECQMQYAVGRSVSHSATFSFNGIGKADWISGGYSVSYTTQWSNGYQCPVPPRSTACIKQGKDYQEYLVDVWDVGSWTGINTLIHPAVKIASPMNGRYSMYCLLNSGHCKYEEYWNWEDFGWGKW